MKKISNPDLLRLLAIIIVLVGVVGSLALMFQAGHNQRSVFLIVAFTAWVISPFIALVVASVKSKHWLLADRITFYFILLLIIAGSLISYSGAFDIHGTKTAFKFLIVPLISWLVIGIVILVVGWRAKRISRKSS